jgi:hypothetical protein
MRHEGKKQMIKLPYFADPKNLEVEEDRREDGPEGETSLELLQTVYRDRKQPLNVRVRCAVEALVHEYPKLSAIAHTRFDFATELDKATAALERAKLRSAQANVPRLNGPVEELPASELKGPMVRLRRF